MKKRFYALLTAILMAAALSAQTIDLTVLATSDIHTNFMDYDYFTDTPTDEQGFVRVATLIRQQRDANANVLLVDDGDTIQGNPFGEYLLRKGGKKSPMMLAMNAIGYDAMTFGNHEFNFGLPYLKAVIKNAKFPVVNANIVKSGTDKPYFTPYVIQKRNFTDTDGNVQQVQVGFLGLVPPQILVWDYNNLHGKVEVKDGYDTAVKYVPEMKANGADIIIILSHSGLSDTPRKGGEENFSWYLTEIPDVDIVVTGHSHARFPSADYKDLSRIDMAKGTINGVPVEMNSSFATYLGVLKAQFQKDGAVWKRVNGSGSIIPVYDTATKQGTPADEEIVSILKPAHEGALAYIRAPVGARGGKGAQLTGPLNSFYAMLHDDYSVQLINDAQLWYGKQYFAKTEYKNLPILSAAAPFKAGDVRAQGTSPTLPAGPLAVKNMADIYVFSNTLAAVKVSGADVREWLERSAGQFNQVVAGKATQIVNPDFRTYNFDVIDGVTYEIDISKPSLYNAANGNFSRRECAPHREPAIQRRSGEG